MGIERRETRMPTEDEERAWLARIEKMFPTIEAWFQRTVQVPPMPVPGSSLAREDQVYGRLPPSHLAYGGIVTAAEHLESNAGLVGVGVGGGVERDAQGSDLGALLVGQGRARDVRGVGVGRCRLGRWPWSSRGGAIRRG